MNTYCRIKCLYKYRVKYMYTFNQININSWVNFHIRLFTNSTCCSAPHRPLKGCLLDDNMQPPIVCGLLSDTPNLTGLRARTLKIRDVFNFSFFFYLLLNTPNAKPSAITSISISQTGGRSSKILIIKSIRIWKALYLNCFMIINIEKDTIYTWPY